LKLHHFLSFSDDSLEANFVSVVATVGAAAVFALLRYVRRNNSDAVHLTLHLATIAETSYGAFSPDFRDGCLISISFVQRFGLLKDLLGWS
jgi:formate hydrogenlyase subunit 3/multisubunit Na+/H+ antiporter MnhD subunit